MSNYVYVRANEDTDDVNIRLSSLETLRVFVN